MKKVIDLVFKKFQAYSFIVFLVLVFGAFFALNQINKQNDPNDNPVVVDDNQDNDDNNDDQTAVIDDEEVLIIPVSSDDYTILSKYWDMSGTEEEQQNAIIKIYDQVDSDRVRYVQNKGMYYRLEENENVEVIAALSGEVYKIEESGIWTNIVIKHSENVYTYYKGLESLEQDLNEGDTIEQGDVIGSPGPGLIMDENSNDFQFLIKVNNISINPESYFGKTLTEIENQ